MIAEEPDDDTLTPAQVAAEIEAAGITLRAGDLQAMIAAAKAGAQVEPRAVELYPLKGCLPAHVSYEVGRRACASGALRSTKLGGDWFVIPEDVAAWLATSGKWFESESAVARWHADIAQLKVWWKT